MKSSRVMSLSIAFVLSLTSVSCNKTSNNSNESFIDATSDTELTGFNRTMINDTLNTVETTITTLDTDEYNYLINNNGIIITVNDSVYLDNEKPFNEKINKGSDYDLRGLLKKTLDIISSDEYSIIATVSEVSNGSSTAYPAIDILFKSSNKEYHNTSILGENINVIIDNDVSYEYDLNSDNYKALDVLSVDNKALEIDTKIYTTVLKSPILSIEDVEIDDKNYVRAEIDTNYVDFITADTGYIYVYDDAVSSFVLLNDTLSVIILFNEVSNTPDMSYFDVLNDTNND